MMIGIATDILGLRDSHFSSVTELLYALEQVRNAPPQKIVARVFMAGASANQVLTNVAAHAAEALNEFGRNGGSFGERAKLFAGTWDLWFVQHLDATHRFVVGPQPRQPYMH
jgi:hypothetical protein